MKSEDIDTKPVFGIGIDPGEEVEIKVITGLYKGRVNHLYNKDIVVDIYKYYTTTVAYPAYFTYSELVYIRRTSKKIE